MRFSQRVAQHLDGNSFSTGLFVSIAERNQRLPNRLDYLQDLVSGKNVVHMGCADHLEVVDQKLASGEWLHARLVNSANRCLGIDINAESVAYLQDVLRYQDVVCADILGDTIPEIGAQRWDYMILGEILEHVDNPVLFLSAIKARYAGMIDKLVITVPNAFKLANFWQALRNCEVVNTDHRYWFTPYTLAKVAARADMHADVFAIVDSYPQRLNWKGRLKFGLRNWLLGRFSALRECIIMEVSL